VSQDRSFEEATVRHTHEDNSFLYFMESLRRGTARCAAKSMNRSVQKPRAPDTRWVTHPPQLLRGLDAHKTSSGECRFPTSRSGTPIIRHSPDSRVVERDFPSHRGVPQRNSIATASVRSQIVGLPASQCWNSLLCLHQGAPLCCRRLPHLTPICWSCRCRRRPQPDGSKTVKIGRVSRTTSSM
jgi:hypothetical protein